jgi:hypothetical protein
MYTKAVHLFLRLAAVSISRSPRNPQSTAADLILILSCPEASTHLRVPERMLARDPQTGMYLGDKYQTLIWSRVLDDLHG